MILTFCKSRRVSSDPPREPLPTSGPNTKSEGSSDLHDKSESLTFVGDYIVEGNVGQGSYGRVKLATHRVTGQKVRHSVILLFIKNTYVKKKNYYFFRWLSKYYKRT